VKEEEKKKKKRSEAKVPSWSLLSLSLPPTQFFF
jgi:hypothetical protein